MAVRTAVVVDDDVDIAEIVAVALEATAGWHVVVGHSGEDALRLAAEHQPDVVILDVMMPGLDGPETWRELQRDARTSRIPVVLLTAKVQIGQRQVWDGLAVAGVIAKPFSPHTLAREVEELVAAYNRDKQPEHAVGW